MKEIDVSGETAQIKCPVCGEIIIDYGEGETNYCKHTMLVTCDFMNGEFQYDGMGKVAKTMLKELKKSEDKSLPELMDEYAQKSKGKYEVHYATTSGMACGPVSNTDYVMFEIKKEKKAKAKK